MEAADGAKRIVIGNEFASVEVRVEPYGNGMQAVVTDRRSGASRRIDVLALEGLVWAPERVIMSLADPGLGEVMPDGRVRPDDDYPPDHDQKNGRAPAAPASMGPGRGKD